MTTADVRAFYQAALVGLAAIEQRQPTGRRFGPEADARWSSFRGDLTTTDRIDLLIRDANAQWPASFGARTVFATAAVAEDEPFGGDWQPLDTVDAEEIWRAQQGAGEVNASPAAALAAVAEVWGLTLAPFDPGAIGAADKLIIAGPSAIAATVAAFDAGSDLDWVDQVTVVATPPAHRQLAALAGALLNATKATRLLVASASAFTAADRAAIGAEPRLVLSQDAAPEDAAKARELAGA